MPAGNAEAAEETAQFFEDRPTLKSQDTISTIAFKAMVPIGSGQIACVAMDSSGLNYIHRFDTSTKVALPWIKTLTPPPAIASLGNGRIVYSNNNGEIKFNSPSTKESFQIVTVGDSGTSHVTQVPAGIGYVTSIAIFDNKSMALGFSRGFVRVYSADKNFIAQYRHENLNRPITLIAVLSDGILASSDGKELYLWDTNIKEKKPLAVVKEYGAVNCEANITSLISGGENRLIQGDSAGNIKVWQYKKSSAVPNEFKSTYRSEITCAGALKNPKPVSQLLLLTETPYLISGDTDGYVRLWDLKTNECVYHVQLELPIESLCLIDETQLAISAGSKLYTFDLPFMHQVLARTQLMVNLNFANLALNLHFANFFVDQMMATSSESSGANNKRTYKSLGPIWDTIFGYAINHYSPTLFRSLLPNETIPRQLTQNPTTPTQTLAIRK